MPVTNRWSLRVHLTILVVAVAAPFLVFLGLAAAGQVRAERARAESTTRLYASVLAARVEQELQSSQQTLARLSERPGAALSGQGECAPLARWQSELPTHVTSLFVVDTAGMVVCSTVPAADLVADGIAGVDWLKRAAASGDVATYRAPAKGNHWLITQVVPLPGQNGEAAGAIGFTADLASLGNEFNRLRLPAGTVAGLADSVSAIRMSARDRNEAFTLPSAGALMALANDSGYAEIGAPGEDARLYAVAPLNDTGWLVYVSVPAAAALAEVNQLILELILAGGATLFIVTGLAMFLSRRIVRPISMLAEQVRAVSNGARPASLPVTGPLEIAIYAEEFNAMLADRASLTHLASHDRLTGLPNRALLRDRLDQAILQARRNHTPVSVLMLDLNRFKQVNDTLGHEAGDTVLVEVANRLRHTLRASDTVARLGGDEFAVVLPETGMEGAQIAASKLVDAMEQPMAVNNQMVSIGASVGAAVYPDNGLDAPALLRNCDWAMYTAKRAGRPFAAFDGVTPAVPAPPLAILAPSTVG